MDMAEHMKMQELEQRVKELTMAYTGLYNLVNEIRIAYQEDDYDALKDLLGEE